MADFFLDEDYETSPIPETDDDEIEPIDDEGMYRGELDLPEDYDEPDDRN